MKTLTLMARIKNLGKRAKCSAASISGDMEKAALKKAYSNKEGPHGL